MAKFVYNNAKNTNISHTFFELKSGYHLYIFYEEDVNLQSQLKLAKELANKLKDLMTIYKKNSTMFKNSKSNITIKI